jgi:O-antigen/teichoic acid export membrane protein
VRISHIAWNLTGMSVPLLVAAITVPALFETLGKEKFGLLALAWGLIGYAGALDLGLGRALTQMVASLRGESKLIGIPDTLLTASRITLVAGLIASVLIALFALLGGSGMIQTQSTSESEIQLSILLLAIALPAQAMSATYKGLNEAFMNFKGVSLLRAGLGIINFAGPYAVSLFSTYLPWLVATLVVSRLVSLLLYRQLAAQCLRRDPETQQTARYSPVIAKKLFSFGAWVTVSSVIGPILVQADRFFIAGIISAAAVSVYVLPYEVVVQSLVLVGAISSVMFPSLSKFMKEQPNNWKKYFNKWLNRVAVIMFCVSIFLIFIFPWLMSKWLGENLDRQSIFIGQILCVGVFANSLGAMYSSVLHASGRSDLTAKLHILELPLYILSLLILIDLHGLKGAALAWVGRMVVDALAIFIMVKKNVH